jgi:hypothetical protein
MVLGSRVSFMDWGPGFESLGYKKVDIGYLEKEI